MEITILEIHPRDTDNGGVINVKVRYQYPVDEKGQRFYNTELVVFIDKSITDLNEVRRLAKEQAINVLKTIVAHHSERPAQLPQK
ncbi:MAG: hypothetical protein RDU76_11400 [Candidatus Edwardsbacteria bacterium]|nr:hypothetical protein [Candidatus Edwardsbacteria bacterium]